MRMFVGCLLAVAAAALPGLARAGVIVSFENPAGYTDAGLRYGGTSTKAAEPMLRAFRTHLERLGERHLRPSQMLKIDVLDIDLAGRFEPWRPRAYDVRIMRDVIWPRRKVRHALEQDGQVLAQGEETIRDQAYLMRAGLLYTDDTLRYEKAMLDDWFQARFVRQSAAVR